VWTLLEETLARAPWIPAVVFEMLDEYIDRLSPDAIAAELEQARAIWRRHQTAVAIA
jgi:hypothetical protein